MVEVKEIIVVCDPSYKDIFEGFPPFSLALVSSVNHVFASWLSIIFFSSDAKGDDQAELKFALPGKERQDSVYNGLQECAIFCFFH